MTIFVLTQYEGCLNKRWWQVPPGRVGRWTMDLSKAKKYASEMAVHIAWTAVSRRHNSVKCVEYPIQEVRREI